MGLLAITAAACLATANGVAVATYDPDQAQVTSLRPHLYATPDATSQTPELMRGLYFGARAGGVNRWLDGAAVDEVGYLGDSGIIRVVQRHGDLTVAHYYFAAFAAELPHLVALAQVTNDGVAPATDAALFLLADLEVGPSETISWVDGGFEERGDAGLVLHRPVGNAPVHAIGPRATVDGGGRLADSAGAGPAAGLVVGFEWDLAGLAPGDSRYAGMIIAIDEGGDRAAVDAELAVLVDAEPRRVLADEEGRWRIFADQLVEPPGLSADERTVYRQSLALIRMAQVREPGPPGGQIVSSLCGGRTVARDHAAALRALVRAGLYGEAAAAARFALSVSVGDHADLLDGPYAVSVLGYRGDGTEETDLVDGSPIVGIDGFGHTLVAIADYVVATGDDDLVRDNALRLFGQTADVLTRWVDIDDTFLLRPDNSIWSGAREKHSYSQASAVWGLRAAAELSPDRASDYRDVAGLFASAIERNLVEDGRLVASLERPGEIDGASVEAFNRGVLAPDGPIARATLDAVDAELALAGGGLRRDSQAGELESHLVDLWVATAARRAGRNDRANELLARVTRAARAESDLVPDRYGDGPAVGLGAGAYVIAMWDRAEAGEGAGGGCGCRSGGSSPAAAMALALLVALAVRWR